jgi:hypothetical protein
MSAIYSLRPEGYRELYNQSLIRSVMTALVLMVIVGIVLVGNRSEGSRADSYVWILFLLIGGYTAYISYRNLKRQKEAWNSFRLIIDESKILRQHIGLPDLSIPQPDITQIIEMPNGDLLIKTARKEIYLAVPRWIELPEEVRERLSAFHPFEPQGQLAFWQQYPWVVTIAMLAVFFTHLFSSTPWLVVATGLPSLAIMVWSTYHMWKSPHILKRVKWVVFIMPLIILSIIFRMLASLGGVGGKKIIVARDMKEQIQENRYGIW